MRINRLWSNSRLRWRLRQFDTTALNPAANIQHLLGRTASADGLIRSHFPAYHCHITPRYL